MKISNSNISLSQNQTFKKGLTSNEINAIKSMTPSINNDLVKNLNKNWGVTINQTLPNTVLKCLHWTIQIMNRAGFELPKNFCFESRGRGILGAYNPTSDTVTINSDYRDFCDLEALNKLEEGHGSFHPNTKHFLSTYLHEFSHAAHYKNICKKLGENDGYKAFMEYLSEHSPSEIIVGPMNKMIKAMFPSLFEEIIEKVFPPENGLYSKTDLTEYIAEYNSRELAKFLGTDFKISNIPQSFSSNYKGYPHSWSIEDRENELKAIKISRSIARFSNLLVPGAGFIAKAFSNFKIASLFQEDIEYLNGEIWNGNINSIIEKSLAFNKQNSY